jgi:hypothetical protein
LSGRRTTCKESQRELRQIHFIPAVVLRFIHPASTPLPNLFPFLILKERQPTVAVVLQGLSNIELPARKWSIFAKLQRHFLPHFTVQGARYLPGFTVKPAPVHGISLPGFTLFPTSVHGKAWRNNRLRALRPSLPGFTVRGILVVWPCGMLVCLQACQ